MNIGLTLLAGATILLSGSTLGLTFKVGAGVITVLSCTVFSALLGCSGR